MLTEQEAQDLMKKLSKLKILYQETNDPKIKRQLNLHETECVEKLKYLITMRTNRYKSFNNYEDLNQEGFLALLKAIKTFEPGKGSFFSWAHNYISTRISRKANLHTTIRYPLKIAKDIPPHKETIMPLQISENFLPDQDCENSELINAVENVFYFLDNQQKQIMNKLYGLNGEKQTSINKICCQLNLTRPSVIKVIKNSLSLIKEQIKI